MHFRRRERIIANKTFSSCLSLGPSPGRYFMRLFQSFCSKVAAYRLSAARTDFRSRRCFVCSSASGRALSSKRARSSISAIRSRAWSGYCSPVRLYLLYLRFQLGSGGFCCRESTRQVFIRREECLFLAVGRRQLLAEPGSSLLRVLQFAFELGTPGPQIGQFRFPFLRKRFVVPSTCGETGGVSTQAPCLREQALPVRTCLVCFCREPVSFGGLLGCVCSRFLDHRIPSSQLRRLAILLNLDVISPARQRGPRESPGPKYGPSRRSCAGGSSPKNVPPGGKRSLGPFRLCAWCLQVYLLCACIALPRRRSKMSCSARGLQ